MPAEAGIQKRPKAQCFFQYLDSGFRRNDDVIPKLFPLSKRHSGLSPNVLCLSYIPPTYIAPCHAGRRISSCLIRHHDDLRRLGPGEIAAGEGGQGRNPPLIAAVGIAELRH